MMRAKSLTFLVTVMTVLCFAATGFAASLQQVDMKTDVPTIPISACDRAGFISFEVGNGFTMTEGDVIQLNLTNKVILCKKVDYFLVIADDTAMTYDQSASTNGAPVITSNVANTIDVGGTAGTLLVAGGTNNVLGFLVKGNANSSRVTLQLARMDTTTGAVTVSNDPADYYQITFDVDTVGGGDVTDLLTVLLFDMKAKTYVDSSSEVGFRKDDVATTADVDYLDDIVDTDNTLCIDTDDPDVVFSDGQYVRATPQSIPASITGVTPTPLTFTGDNTVATVSGTTGYTVEAVGKGTCPTVTISPELDQDGDPIEGTSSTFDMGDYTNPCLAANYDDGRWQQSESNICASDANTDGKGRGIIISRSNAYDNAEQMRITMSLAIMRANSSTYAAPGAATAWIVGNTAEGIYFTQNGTDGNVSCTAAAIDEQDAGYAFATTADGTEDVETSAGTVTRIIEQRTGWMVPGDSGIAGFGSDRDSMMVDANTVYFDKSMLSAGDTLYWKVTTERYPCGVVDESYVCIFTAQECDTDTTASYELTFPYGIGADNVNFWSGLNITNLSSTDGSATATFYGMDGTMGTYTFDVEANNITNFSMLQIKDSITGGLSSSVNFYCVVETDFEADGLMLIGGKGANAGVLHGYLPRK